MEEVDESVLRQHVQLGAMVGVATALLTPFMIFRKQPALWGTEFGWGVVAFAATMIGVALVAHRGNVAATIGMLVLFLASRVGILARGAELTPMLVILWFAMVFFFWRAITAARTLAARG